MSRGLSIGLALALALATAAASATPITMTPNAVGLPLVGGVPNAYEISLLSGDTENYRLNFQLSGPGGSFTVGASVMVFDDVTLTHLGKISVNDMYFFGLDVGSHNAAG